MSINPCIEEVLITTEMIEEKCKELGKLLTIDYDGKKPILVGLLKGCVPFMAELIKNIECDIEIDFMDASSYVGVESVGKITIKKDIDANVEGRHIVIVDDIIDTGLTLKEVVRIFKDRGAASVETVTLVNKPKGRTVQGAEPKYIGYDIPNRFVVGFGLDYNEIYRNLPYIGVLKKSVYEK